MEQFTKLWTGLSENFFTLFVNQFKFICRNSPFLDGGKNTRVINVPLEAEALFADKLAAPYGKSFESWVSSKNFSKDNQYPAGGYKIWSDSGEYLPKGEVIYRWPTEELPSRGMLEIFGDDHVHIELIHEGKHLTAGVGSVVINLESLPPFYDVLILRFSSQNHTELWYGLNIICHMNQFKRGSCSYLELSTNLWQPADSLAFMNLNSDRYFWVKRNYQVVGDAGAMDLEFFQRYRRILFKWNSN